MGLEGFIEPFCSALANHQMGKHPTPQDKQCLNIAIDQFKAASIADASQHLDKFLQALLLQELWANRQITDNDIHGYMNSLLWRYLPMNDDMKGNRFFYMEMDELKNVNNGLDVPSMRGIWRRKGDTCLIVGGLFGDYVRTETPKSLKSPSANDTRSAGKRAYKQAQALFGRFAQREEQNLAQICESIHDNYEALEDSLYSLGRNHFFPRTEDKIPSDIVIPNSIKSKKTYNLNEPLPITIGELIRRSRVATLYRELFNKGYYD